MKKMIKPLLCLAFGLLMLSACGSGTAATEAAAQESASVAESTAAAAESDGNAAETDTQTEAAEPASESSAENSKVAGAEDMTDVIDVVEEGMVPVQASALKDGTYDVQVDSSSSMFKILSCELTVADGTMTADLLMNSGAYTYMYMGSAEEAASAPEDDCIALVTEGEANTFTIPVEALDAGIECAAFSKRKELWYERTLLFRADSLPLEAYADGVLTTAESLALENGEYTVEVELSGGSGKASVASPARLVVEDGSLTATVMWSSSNYDYMKVDGVQYFPVNTEGNSVFEIPVTVFDYRMPVLADTTAMSQPHEIEYTLYFDSASITPVS